MYTDGAARGNPGLGGAGAVIYDEQQAEVAAVSKYLGSKVTNNEAEYQALILGLQHAQQLSTDKLEIFMDSKLIVQQVKGNYQVKSVKLKPLFIQVKQLLRYWPQWSIEHVYRNNNKRADELANLGIDQRVLN